VRSGAARGHTGYLHEVAFYGSDGAFVDVVAPFLLGGVDAGEPTVAACRPAAAALLRDAVGVDGVTYVDALAAYARPARTIRTLRELFAAHAGEGSPQIRIVGDVPHPGTGASWEAWARYEAAANRAFADLPVWGLCPYDTRISPDAVLGDVERTHPFVAGPDGRHDRNDAYTPPERFLAERPDPAPDPIEATPPSVALLDPTPASVRRAVGAQRAWTRVPPEALDDFALAASEAVTNAMRHGLRPVRFRMWTRPDRVVATIADAGGGPSDPLAGLLPPDEHASDGYGLWIVHQTCDEVAFRRGADGFTLRIATRATPAAG
jgi:anti-sigma regulatory factor (Ser/Thr protein kinase)